MLNFFTSKANKRVYLIFEYVFVENPYETLRIWLKPEKILFESSAVKKINIHFFQLKEERKKKRQEKRKNRNKNKKGSRLEYVDIEEEPSAELDDVDYDVEDKSFDRNVHTRITCLP